MKNLLAMLLALVLTTSVCSAATVKTNTGANLKIGRASCRERV